MRRASAAAALLLATIVPTGAAKAQADSAVAMASDWDSLSAMLDEMEGAAITLGDSNDFAGAATAYARLHTATIAAMERFSDTPEHLADLRARRGAAALDAAEAMESTEDADAAAMVALLSDAADQFAIVQTTGDEDAQAFEWRNAADMLFDWGIAAGDLRLPQFSAMRVRANRERVKRYDRLLEGLEFEESMLAMALIDHGAVANDQAATGEGLAIARRLGDDAIYDLTDKIGRLAAGGSPINLPAPLATALDRAQTDVSSLESEAYELALKQPVDHEKLTSIYQSIRDRAAPMIARSRIDPADHASFLNSAASAAQSAAEHLGATGDDMTLPSDPAVLRARAALLVEAQDWFAALRAVDPKGEVAGPVGTAWASDSLFDIGMRLNPPEWADWSRKRVAAKRDEAAIEDDIFSREQLAMALFDHGWLTKDAAVIAEAQAMMTALGDNAGFFLKRKAERIASGKPPYDVSD